MGEAPDHVAECMRIRDGVQLAGRLVRQAEETGQNTPLRTRPRQSPADGGRGAARQTPAMCRPTDPMHTGAFELSCFRFRSQMAYKDRANAGGQGPS